MSHPIKKNFPANVLATGEHAGYSWLVAHNDLGYRCGYVRVPPGHPWNRRGYDDIKANAHGGLTYTEADTDGVHWWAGFDCAHCWDAQDPKLPSTYRMPESLAIRSTIRTQEFVEAECRSLCEQAKKAATNAARAKKRKARK